MGTFLRVVFLSLLVSALPAGADPYSTSSFLVKGTDHVRGIPAGGTRPEGETLADPIEIPLLPYQDSRNTCAYENDMDEPCPYLGSTSPDVVYRLVPTGSGYCSVDLCASLYDTKVYIYEFESGHGPGSPLACNDDAGCGYSGYQSRVELFLEQGRTYYIVVDGYGGDCGTYTLSITDLIYEILVCPGGALLEGEEECHDDYEDATNPGCGAYGAPVFTPLAGTPGGAPFDVCGTGGTFLHQGMQYRDTDWYELHVTEPATIAFTCKAEFPVQIFMLDGNGGCDGMQILDFDTAGIFPDEAYLERAFSPGTYWFWVGSSVFDGVSCGSLYVMTIEGYAAPPTAAAAPSWGSVKALFR